MPAKPFAAPTYEARATFGRAIRASGVMACVLALLGACNGDDITSPSNPNSASPADKVLASATVGAELPAPVRLAVTQSNGAPAPQVRVRWLASEGGTVSSAQSLTDAAGVATVRWTLGTVAGPQKLVAQVDGLDPVAFGVTAKPDRATSIVLSSDSLVLSLLGDTTRFDPRVIDRFGNELATKPSIQLESNSDALTIIPELAAIVARNRGETAVLFSSAGIVARVPVRVEPASPRPTRIAGDTIRIGVPFAIDGESFALSSEFVQVHVNGKPADVLSISRTRIEAILPTGSTPCQATQAAQVRVMVAGAVGETTSHLRVATRLDLAKGESASLLDPAEAQCTELVAPSGGSSARFVVAVINTSVATSTTSEFELRGAGAGGLSGLTAVSLDAQSMNLLSSGNSVPTALTAFEKAEDGHGEFLDRQREVARRNGSPTAKWRSISATRAGVAAAQIPPAVGSVVTMRALYSSCTSGRDVQARVVHAGTRSIVLEDISAPKAGTMDAEYRAIGQEFDAVQYPLLAESIGDPLAMNASMEGDGRVTMLFTSYVNDSLPGIAGYVTACNFYPKSTFASSNEDEVFYARVPGAGETPAEWRRSMRSTVIHEAKHLASFAERFARGNSFEESWLEESTARIAEELYSRRFEGGGSWKGNTGYASSVRCEVYQCDDRPLMMWKHFTTLHSYYRGIDTLTPIGAASSGDYTFYASGWSLVRWAADHYATNEGQWLRELVRGNGQQTGLSNLAQRTGRPVGEMLSDWALAHAVDDLAGFSPRRTQLTMPSWNTADVMGGLSETYPGMFVAKPLNVRNYSFGQFSLPIGKLRAFSTSYFSFSGNQGGSQVVELRGAAGGMSPGSLRLAVVRVE